MTPKKLRIRRTVRCRFNQQSIASASHRYIIGTRLHMTMTQSLSIPGVAASSTDAEPLRGCPESLARMPFRLNDPRSFKEFLLLSVTDELDELVV